MEYLELCRAFWCPDDRGRQGDQTTRGMLQGWIDEIREGHIPDFGPNLIY